MIAEIYGWCWINGRKPKGYWANNDNARKFLDKFAASKGLSHCAQDWKRVTQTEFTKAGVGCV